jgi:hypothetical protein
MPSAHCLPALDTCNALSGYLTLYIPPRTTHRVWCPCMPRGSPSLRWPLSFVASQPCYPQTPPRKVPRVCQVPRTELHPLTSDPAHHTPVTNTPHPPGMVPLSAQRFTQLVVAPAQQQPGSTTPQAACKSAEARRHDGKTARDGSRGQKTVCDKVEGRGGKGGVL